MSKIANSVQENMTLAGRRKWGAMTLGFRAPIETCHILVYNIYIYHSRRWGPILPGFPPHPLSILMRLDTYIHIKNYHIPLLQYKRLSGTRASLGARYREISKLFFFAPPSDIVGGLAQELVWEQDTEKYRKYFFCTL